MDGVLRFESKERFSEVKSLLSQASPADRPLSGMIDGQYFPANFMLL